MLSYIKKSGTALILFTGLAALSCLFIINSRSLYMLVMKPLHISARSGLSSDEILKNYNVLIDYCSPFTHSRLTFPTLPSSSSALSHFAEVKHLFSLLYLLAAACLLSVRLFLRHMDAPDCSSILKKAGRGCLFFPLCLCLLFTLDFHDVFFAIHRVLFHNNDWLFDSATDPVILLLPEEFFRICGFAVMVILMIFGLGLLRLGAELSVCSGFPLSSDKPIFSSVPALYPPLQEMQPIFLPAPRNISDSSVLPDPSDAGLHPSPDHTAHRDTL